MFVTVPFDPLECRGINEAGQYFAPSEHPLKFCHTYSKAPRLSPSGSMLLCNANLSLNSLDLQKIVETVNRAIYKCLHEVDLLSAEYSKAGNTLRHLNT